MVNRFVFALGLAFLIVGCGGGGGGSERTPDNNACDVLNLNTRIINGTQCEQSGSPVVRVLLVLRNGSTGLCSGSLITPNEVLTAAHCFAGRVVSTTVDIGGQLVSARRVIVHPAARVDTENFSVFNDVAIIKLRRSVSTTPLAILTSQSTRSGDIISLFGYGLDENGGSDIFKSGEMKVSSVTENHIMAAYSGDGSNSCNGDSGGPAVLEKNGAKGIVGLVSSGQEVDCGEGDVTLFARTNNSSVLNFIIENAPAVTLN